jgi:hypothetical protein
MTSLSGAVDAGESALLPFPKDLESSTFVYLLPGESELIIACSGEQEIAHGGINCGLPFSRRRRETRFHSEGDYDH